MNRYQQGNHPAGPKTPAEPRPAQPRSAGGVPPMDRGPEPYVVNIEQATLHNNAFRAAIWTGTHLQATLMSIPAGGEIGLEMHPKVDQFLRVEAGQGMVKMGSGRDRLVYQRKVEDGFAVFVPAGTWHNLINTGREPLKLYSIYAPPQHPWGTVHLTKADSDAAEKK